MSDQNNKHDSTNTENKNDKPNTEPKKVQDKPSKPIPKVKGTIKNDLFFESIMVEGKPTFLVKYFTTGQVTTVDKLKHNNEIWRPLEKTETPYEPYIFTQEEIAELTKNEISTEEILDKIRSQIDYYIVADEKIKTLVQGDILLTYCQEWIDTLHYPFSAGETESGKSTILHLAKHLCYRCLFSSDIPSADIYNFLGMDEEGTGTICEDEAQGLDNYPEKIRLYKTSYARGAVMPRIIMQPEKKQVYYKTYCCKWYAGERVPSDKGFRERLAIIHMNVGTPKGNLKRASIEEIDLLRKLRKKLLIWKIQRMGQGLTRIQSGLTQRNQEMFEDFLSIFVGTKYYKQAQETVEYFVMQRENTIRDSLEAGIFKILVSLLDENLEIASQGLWNILTESNPEMPGRLEGRTFYPSESDAPLTQNTLASILEYKFHARKIVKRVKVDDRYHRKTCYKLTREQIESLARRYRIDVENNES